MFEFEISFVSLTQLQVYIGWRQLRREAIHPQIPVHQHYLFISENPVKSELSCLLLRNVTFLFGT